MDCRVSLVALQCVFRPEYAIAWLAEVVTPSIALMALECLMVDKSAIAGAAG